MENISGVLVPGILALIFIIVGLPLAYRKIKPNYLYGYRLSQIVINNAEIWYTVNKIGGKHLLIVGCILLLISVISIFYTNRPDIQGVFLTTGLLISVIGVAFSWWRTYSIANKMAKEKGLK